MSVDRRMSTRFKGIQGGLFKESGAGSGLGPEDFVSQGYDYMAWSDMFFPDPSTPESVKRAIRDAVDTGTSSHYVMAIGPNDLRSAIAEDLAERIGRSVDPKRNVLVTPGSGPALLYSAMPFISDGDEVMVPEPCYTANLLNNSLIGAVTVPVPLHEKDNYQPRMEEFEKRLTDKTKIVIITHPNNPTTTVYRRKSLEALCAFIVENDLILISDNVNQDMVYDNIEFVHPCTLPGMWERTLTVGSVSKGIGLGGLRIGYILADDKIMDVLYGAALSVLGVPSTLSAIGALAAIKDKNILKENFERNERRRRIAYEVLGNVPGVSMKMSESGIIAWLNVSELGTAHEVALHIKEKARVVIDPGVEYGAHGEGYIRIVTSCYARDEDAAERFGRIRDALAEMAKDKGVC